MKQYIPKVYVFRKTIALACLLLLTAHSGAEAVLVEFDSTTAFGDNFTNVNSGNALSYNSTAGRGGSGTMFLQATGHTANVYSGTGAAFSLGAGESIVVSYFFYEGGTRSATDNIGIYLTTSSSTDPLDAATTTGVLRTFFYNMDPVEPGNQTNFRYSGTGGTGNVGTNFTGGGNDFWDPNASTWWQLEVTYTKTGTVNLWDITADISNWGSDGLTYNESSLITLNGSLTNASLYSADSIYVGFESYQQNRGATKIDTFAINVIPEPSTAALLGTMGIVSAIFACRSRKKADALI